MTIKTPPEILGDWLAQQTKETAASAVAIDSDRFLIDGSTLSKYTLVDPAGLEWQLAIFRGDDLAFRLRFREASSKGPTLIVLTRGPETIEPIDVSFVADILAKK